MNQDDISAPAYFTVVDCGWGLYAHTPVPEYIRVMAKAAIADSYMSLEIERVRDFSDAPAISVRARMPAARVEKPRSRSAGEAVAANSRPTSKGRMPRPSAKNGKRIAIVGGGPALVTVGTRIAPIGYPLQRVRCRPKPGGMMRTDSASRWRIR